MIEIETESFYMNSCSNFCGWERSLDRGRKFNLSGLLQSPQASGFNPSGSDLRSCDSKDTFR